MSRSALNLLRSPSLSWAGRTVHSAVLTVTGLGFYEIDLNGAKVGDAVLDPGFSNDAGDALRREE